MSLVKYFSRVKTRDGLHNPVWSVSSSLIEEVNKEVSAQLPLVNDSGNIRI